MKNKRVPLLKYAAYLAIPVVLLLGFVRAVFFGDTRDGSIEGGDPMTVLCFGDSNTYAYDPRSYFGDRYPVEARWVDILAEKTGLITVNEGENGREIPRRDESCYTRISLP